MNFKRLWAYLLIALVSFSLLTGCGSSSKEAKELLTRILQIVGIPYEIVVNICQDGNDNGFCEANELQTKITINKGDSFQTILHKIQLTEDGRYFLKNYNPTKKILMELKDNKILNNSGQKVTLPYEPKDIEEVPIQELSILQALIDNGLINEEEIKKLRESGVRPKIDAVLLENLFENQTILVDHNMSDTDARDRNLEYIVKGLQDMNVSGNLVENLENCKNNKSCEESILEEAKKQTKISEEEAVIIAENNSIAGTGDRETTLTSEEEAVIIAENNSTEGTGDKDTSLTSEESNSYINLGNTLSLGSKNITLLKNEPFNTQLSSSDNLSDFYNIKFPASQTDSKINSEYINFHVKVTNKQNSNDFVELNLNNISVLTNDDKSLQTNFSKNTIIYIKEEIPNKSTKTYSTKLVSELTYQGLTININDIIDIVDENEITYGLERMQNYLQTSNKDYTMSMDFKTSLNSKLIINPEVIYGNISVK